MALVARSLDAMTQRLDTLTQRLETLATQNGQLGQEVGRLNAHVARLGSASSLPPVPEMPRVMWADISSDDDEDSGLWCCAEQSGRVTSTERTKDLKGKQDDEKNDDKNTCEQDEQNEKDVEEDEADADCEGRSNSLLSQSSSAQSHLVAGLCASMQASLRKCAVASVS